MADEIIARNDSTPRTPAPEGQFLAVCCDVIDLGKVENKKFSKVQHKCCIGFQLDEINPETGKRWEVFERFTVSMWEKANLRKFLGNWRGKPYTDQEADAGAPLHKLEGVPALVQVEHREGNDRKLYANIGSIMKAPRGSSIVIEGYERSAGWKKGDMPAHAATDDLDSDLPF